MIEESIKVYKNLAEARMKDCEEYKKRINKAIKICEPLVEWGECTINGKILKQIYEILKGESNDR